MPITAPQYGKVDRRPAFDERTSQCNGKVQYVDFTSAKNAKHQTWPVYKCRFCGYFHRGSA